MIYKYLPHERTDVLKNLKIRFTQPKALNDPFEALPLVSASKEKMLFFKQGKRGFWEYIKKQH